MKNKILVVVDMQEDFVNGALGTPEARDIVPAVSCRIAAAHEVGDQVIFTRDTHQENYLDTQEGKYLKIPHCIKGTKGHEIVPEIAAEIDLNDDIILDKPTFGSNELMDEIRFIEEAVGQIDQIEFVGLCTGICVIANAVLAKTRFPETEIKVNGIACACVSPDSHNTALAAMELLQIEVERW